MRVEKAKKIFQISRSATRISFIVGFIGLVTERRDIVICGAGLLIAGAILYCYPILKALKGFCLAYFKNKHRLN